MTDQKFHSVAPLFTVSNLLTSVDFYCDVLGFERPQLWGDPPGFAMPKRDDCIVMLSQAKEDSHVSPNHSMNGHWDAYFWVRDAKVLFEDYKAKGAEFHYELELRESYGNWEFAVFDPDKHLIAFGQNAGEGSWFGDK